MGGRGPTSITTNVAARLWNGMAQLGSFGKHRPAPIADTRFSRQG